MTQTVREELLAIQRESSDGLLHATEIVDWARGNPDSALHRHFVWDDVRAANEYRLDQARALIRMHVVAENGEPQLVSLTFDRARGGGYRQLEDVLNSRELSDILLGDALQELERVRRKYARLEALTSVWREVEVVKRKRPPSDEKDAHAG